MKILIVSPDFPPPFEGGSLVYMYNIAMSLSHITPLLNTTTPADITILTSPADSYTTDKKGRENLPANIRIIRNRFLTRSFDPTRLQLVIMYAYLFFFMIKILITKSYDAILTSTGVVGNSIIIFISNFFKIPSVSFAYAEEITIPLTSAGTKNLLKKFLLKRIYPLSSHIITVCEFTKKVLADRLGVPLENITVISPMVESRKHKENTINTDAGKRKNQIISVGRLVKRKGFRNLIQAFRIVVNDIPDAKLVIVGRGPEEPDLHRLIEEYHLHNNIILKGCLSDDALVQEYSVSKGFVLANLTLSNGDTEGCPTVILEAMAHGLPVIAGIDGGTSEAITDGVTGYLIDSRNIQQLADKIKILLTDETIASKLGAAGKSRIETEHSLIKTDQKLMTVLNMLATQTRY